jgi:bacteriocin-processing peptidase. Cysteine peptidase. MEROPS family C39
MKPILLVILVALMHSNLLAQMTISGKISDKNNKAIAGSSIFVKDSYIGSISNRDGKFSIKIPQHLQSGKLCISCIGYQMQEIAVSEIQSPIQICLQKDTVNIAEVLVMPKDTLLALLRRAYGKIKDNYPDEDTRMKGLYRETYYIPKTKEYLYFGEAQVDIFKTSYRNKSEGQVKIVNSRMNKHPLYDSLSTVMWYGGVHMLLYDDEATPSLDSISEEQVQNCIKGLKEQGKTIVLIAHRLGTVLQSDKIIVLEKGKLMEEGSHSKLYENQGKYYQMWQKQMPELSIF